MEKGNMTSHFTPSSFRDLTHLVFSNLSRGHFFGIPRKLFFNSLEDDPFKMERYGRNLETPVGVAAGPHTQLAQNIIGAWLCGARYIELKTVQVLDGLTVTKPCIDMQDEGYNCEWSQELSIHESFDQYLNAWILIHILRHKFNMNDGSGAGMIFNMSVGYDLKGIQSDKVQWFLSKMTSCRDEIRERLESVSDFCPEASEADIPDNISDNVTLSTMHGCPPEEIEEIGKYLLDKGFHTTIKLNPTLLGKDFIEAIFRRTGFGIRVPDAAFEHDLKYPDALRIIRSLKKKAAEVNREFSVKLTNTLETVNQKRNLPEKEQTVYMSGKALHPVSVALAEKLGRDFNGKLDISFAGGANCFNISRLISGGLGPVTVCSDLLRPGGYGLLAQYLENIRDSFRQKGAKSIDEYIIKSSGQEVLSAEQAALMNLKGYSLTATEDCDNQKKVFFDPDIKSGRPLEAFDCIHAPCTDACPTNQDIPDYLYFIATRDIGKAFDSILKMNPFPNVTGTVCEHACQNKCNRMNYEDSLMIRNLKRFVAERSKGKEVSFSKAPENGIRVAIIGSGPSGLACGYFLSLAGFSVKVYEAKGFAGGMVTDAIPSFRLSDKAFESDLERIRRTGVEIIYNSRIDKGRFKSIREENDFVYLGVGAQKSKAFDIEGADCKGVIDPLDFLSDLKKGNQYYLGNWIAVIGGGNTAMDVARAAKRAAKDGTNVTILYRRTLREMPADPDEIRAALNEGIEIQELVAPVEIKSCKGLACSLVCKRMKLAGIDKSGRPAPVPLEGSDFEIPVDTIIPAIGQDVVLDFTDLPVTRNSGAGFETGVQGLYIGGDARRGASSVIAAIGDGRKAAEAIMQKAHISHNIPLPPGREPSGYESLMIKRYRKEKQADQTHGRQDLDGGESGFDEISAVKEASRCLLCDELCNICTTLCPNFALFPYTVEPVDYKLYNEFGPGSERISAEEGIFSVKQKHQILHIDDWCNQCGNCRTFCPTSGAPYLDKPHLILDYDIFLISGGSYYFQKKGERYTLYYNNNGKLESLSEGEKWIFSSEGREASINKSTFEIAESIAGGSTERINLRRAAEMSVIIQGAKQFFNL